MANKLLQSLKFPGLSDTYLIPLMNNFAPAYSSTSTYAVGDCCSHDNTFYVCKTAISTAEAWTAGHWDEVSVADIATAIGADVDDLKEALDSVETTLTHKADVDGTVASAEQLLSDVGTEDKAPYLFRAVPYDSTRVDEEVVGCSVGWNQLTRFASSVIPSARNGITFTSVDGTACKMAGTATDTVSAAGWFGMSASTLIANHIYFVSTKKVSGSQTVDNGVYFEGGGFGHVIGNTIIGKSNGANPALKVTNGNVLTDFIWTGNCIDLTAWFDSTIADYAYTLEQATAGSGVAFIKALLPGGYIPYSAPKMESVSGLSGHRFVGFNQWDEEWEVGSYNSADGEKSTSTQNIRSKNAIRVFPGATYYVRRTNNVPVVILQYDAEGKFITSNNISSNLTYTTGLNTHYIRFYTGIAYGTTYNHDICINLSKTTGSPKNGDYVPYDGHTYALDSDLTLRGILKMDASNHVYADGDVYLGEGKKNERYAEVDLGSLNWTYNTTDTAASVPYFMATLSSPKYGTGMMSSKYPNTGGGRNTLTDKTMALYNMSNSPNICIADSSFTDAATFKASLAGVKLVYEKATPTTEEAEPFASPQNCTPGGTEEYVYGESGSGVPVGHNSKYQKNLRSEIERVSVAVPEVGSTAGTYTLKATVTAQGVTYGWVSD